MEVQDYLEPEVAVAATVAAVVFSPRGRQILRRGAVYGIAGALIAGDAITSFARNVGQGFRQAGAATNGSSSPQGTPEAQGGQA